MKTLDRILDMERRWLLLADDEIEDAGGGDVSSDPPAGKEDAAASPLQPAAPSDQLEKTWRDAITDPDARKLADDSTDVEHLAKRALDMRQKLSKAVVLPGKDAEEAEVAAFRKALGVPETIEGYSFPELPDDDSIDKEAAQASREGWAKTFHDLNVPKATAELLIARFQDESQRILDAQIKADQEYTEAIENQLKADWGPDYEGLKKTAELAASQIFGDAFEELRFLEDKHGKYLLENPLVIKALARHGKEMLEGKDMPVSDDQRQTLQDEAAGLRKQAEQALMEGNRSLANRLSEQERQIYAKMQGGTQEIVGVGGRTV